MRRHRVVPAPRCWLRGEGLLAGVAVALLGSGTVHAQAVAPYAAEPAVSPGSVLSSPAGSLASGPRGNGTAVLPDGRFVTPVGHSVGTELEPQNGVLSHDGKRLYVSSEGVDADPPASPNHDNTRHARYVTIMDTRTLASMRFEDDALHSGLAESADGLTLFVAEGQTDTLGVFRRTPATDGGIGTFQLVAHHPLHAASPKDYPTGLALSPDGTKAYLSGFSGDTLTTLDTATGAVLSRVPTGSYPYNVVVSSDGSRAYVTNMGLYNADAATGQNSPIAPPPVTFGGYNSSNSASVWSYDLTGAAPSVVAATKIGLDLNGADVVGGSSPSGLALAPDGKTLAVTSSSDDQVELLDTTRSTPSAAVPSANAPSAPAHPTTTVDMRALVGTPALPGPAGAQPNAVTWTPDGKVLLVGEGERNDIVIIDPAKIAIGAADTSEGPTGTGVGTGAGPNRGAIVGRLPTAWYPSALQVSADSSHLFVVSMKGLGAGANTQTAGPPATATDTSGPAASYIPNLIHGRVTDIEMSAACQALPALSRQSDIDNGLVPSASTSGSAGNGYVVPTAYGQPASDKIKHVFLIIKENRSYDQIFGDQAGTESDNNYAWYGRPTTPNAHAIADQFALSDNYYATTETSSQGHNAIDTGQVNEFVDKVTPSSYANKYPYGAFDTVPENLPQSGFIWNNAARHGVHTTVFGEGTFVTGVAPVLLGRSPTDTSVNQLVPGTTQDGFTTYYAPYPSQVNPVGGTGPIKGTLETAFPYNDEGRAAAFAQAVAAGNVVSQLNVMILFDDHTSGDIAGANTPERQIAENDHALGEVVSTIGSSQYGKDSAIFVTEDDTQNGQDHVDAYRTLALVASPYAKTGHVSHVHTSFSSMTKTINLILGLPATSLQEMTATSMQDMFISSGAPASPTFVVQPNNTVAATNASAADAPNAALKAAAALARTRDPGVDKGGSALSAELALDRAGEVQAGDPNATPTTNVVRHTLPLGSPEAVTLGAPVPTHGVPAADTCLIPADAAAPALSQASQGGTPAKKSNANRGKELPASGGATPGLIPIQPTKTLALTGPEDGITLGGVLAVAAGLALTRRRRRRR